MPDERKKGSVALSVIMGIALLFLGLVIWRFGFNPKEYAVQINVVACVFFGVILLWWAATPNRDWGIGFPSITMAVTVVLAVIAILTLTYVASHS